MWHVFCSNTSLYESDTHGTEILGLLDFRGSLPTSHLINVFCTPVCIASPFLIAQVQEEIRSIITNSHIVHLPPSSASESVKGAIEQVGGTRVFR